MAFVRVSLVNSENVDANALSRIIEEHELAMDFPDNPAAVPFFLIPGIANQASDLVSLAQKLYTQSTEDDPCEIIVTDKPPKSCALALKGNAAYVRYQDKLYYFHKLRNGNVWQELKIPSQLKQFDECLQINSLSLNAARRLSIEELEEVTALTHHYHPNKRSIYIYQDSNLAPNVDSEAISMAKLMESKLPYGPYFIIAYSYAALPAMEIMQYFKDKGSNAPVFTIILDAPSPENSKRFIQEKSPAYFQNLTDIENYISRLQIPDTREYVKQRLEKLGNFNREFDKPLPGTIFALITDETARKYRDARGGWEGYATNVEFEQSLELKRLSHQELTYEENADLLANAIMRFVDSKMSNVINLVQLESLKRMLTNSITFGQNNKDSLLVKATNHMKELLEKYSPDSTPSSKYLSPENSTSPLGSSPQPIKASGLKLFDKVKQLGESADNKLRIM